MVAGSVVAWRRSFGVRFVDEDGTRGYRGGFGSEREAQAWLDAKAAEAAAGASSALGVTAAVVRDLAALGDDGLAAGSLAAAALELAAQLDDPGNSATSKSMCATSLARVMDRLLELAPPRVDDSPLLRIRRRRDERVAKGSK